MRVIIPFKLDSWPDHRKSSFVRFLGALGIRTKRTNPVVLTVTEIRNEIFAASQGVWGTRSTTRLLGRIFHESIADLFRPGPHCWYKELTAADMADSSILARHLYQHFVSARLIRYQAALSESTSEVLDFWIAVKEWSEWFCAIVRKGLETRQLSFDEVHSSWVNVSRLVEPERELSYVLDDRDWSAPVRIEGRADGVLRKPGTKDWCILEYKLGTGAPEADVAQAIMYQMMLSGEDSSPGSVALIQLQPKLCELYYSAGDLRLGIEMLKPMIGRLAGVLPPDPVSSDVLSILPNEPASVAPPLDSEASESLDSTPTGPLSDSLELVRHPDSSLIAGFDIFGRRIVEICKEFGAEVTLVGSPTPSSAFIRYIVSPAPGVPAKKISALAVDLQVRMGLDASPLIRVDRGKLAIDIARKDRQPVMFSQIRGQLSHSEVSSRVPLGVDLRGSLKFADLANPVSAHMLVAGSTGSGKTEWLRSAIAGLMLQNTPQSLRFALIDPKGGAFGDLQGSPFLWKPEAMVSPSRENSAVGLFELLIDEMEIRYRAMELNGAEDLARLWKKTGTQWPRIVCVCDEYADLVAQKVERRNVESRIARLGAKARAAGIHLIIATQRPSRDIVEGTLKANLSCKIALRVQSHIESRLVLGTSGAEHLLGDGDLLFQDVGAPVRLQAPYLLERERAEIFGSAPVSVA